MRHTLSKISTSLLIAAAGLASSSCSMMTEDRDGCPDGLYVRFIYDYNTVRADLFKDHLGYLRLMVFDEAGRLAAERTVSNSSSDAPLSRYGYTVHFTPAELPTGHTYRLQAVGMQRDWSEAQAEPGARYRLNAPQPLEAGSMTVALDHLSEPIAGTEQFPVDASAPLDTLWHTLKVITHDPKDGTELPGIDRTEAPFSIYPLEDQMVEVRKDHATYATVSLIRDTKHLNLTLRQVDQPEDIDADDFEVMVLDNNAVIGHDNSVIPGDSVRYTPYAAWTSTFTHDDNASERTAHYNLMFNRLMINPDDVKDNASLVIRAKRDGKLVARINLPYILSQGRQAFDLHNYSEQEYLDREYDYSLDFFLKGGEWVMIELHVLSWTKRLQNLELD